MIPRRRDDRLVVERAEHEVLIYDLAANHAHLLDEAAATVWDLCDGRRSDAEIVASAGLSPAVVDSAIAQLTGLGLLTVEHQHTRRETLRKTLVGAGALAALPVITSISAPEAAQAASLGGTGTPCTTGAECASTVCTANLCT